MDLKEIWQEHKERKAHRAVNDAAYATADYLADKVTDQEDGPYCLNLGRVPKVWADRPEVFMEKVGWLAMKGLHQHANVHLVSFDHDATLSANMTPGPDSELKDLEVRVVFNRTEQQLIKDL